MQDGCVLNETALILVVGQVDPLHRIDEMLLQALINTALGPATKPVTGG
jgi:hypothetical protein